MLRSALFAALLAAGSMLHAKELLLTADRMLDVRSGKTIAPAAVLVRDGRIVEAGANAHAMADAERIDLGDMTLLPGLIDMHVHLDSDPTFGGYTGLQFNDRFWSRLCENYRAAGKISASVGWCSA